MVRIVCDHSPGPAGDSEAYNEAPFRIAAYGRAPEPSHSTHSVRQEAPMKLFARFLFALVITLPMLPAVPHAHFILLEPAS